MQATQADWLPARAALHPTGLYFALRDIRPADLQDPSMQETVARLPGRESFVQVAPGHGRLLPYETLPASAWERVAPHFGRTADASLRSRMQAAAAMDAKAPIGRPAPFADDSAAKREAASGKLHTAVDRVARPALQRLLALHAGAAAPAASAVKVN